MEPKAQKKWENFTKKRGEFIKKRKGGCNRKANKCIYQPLVGSYSQVCMKGIFCMPRLENRYTYKETVVIITSLS